MTSEPPNSHICHGTATLFATQIQINGMYNNNSTTGAKCRPVRAHLWTTSFDDEGRGISQPPHLIDNPAQRLDGVLYLKSPTPHAYDQRLREPLQKRCGVDALLD